MGCLHASVSGVELFHVTIAEFRSSTAWEKCVILHRIHFQILAYAGCSDRATLYLYAFWRTLVELL